MTSAPAPTFSCPLVDVRHIWIPTYGCPSSWSHSKPPTLLIGIPGHLTICGQTFYHQHTTSHTAEKDKFKIQGLELFELIISKVSLTSKLIAKTQLGYLQVMQTNCPHELMATMAASHQISSVTSLLSALAHYLSIRQNGQSHLNLVDKINTAFDHVVTCWESSIHAGYIATEDLRAALLILCEAAIVAISSCGQLVCITCKYPSCVFAINFEVSDTFEKINSKSSSPWILNLSFSAVCDVVCLTANG